jgi:uncharacterized protein YcbX
MTPSPCLSRIYIYPIKSLDRVDLETWAALPSGALVGDREFAIIDQHGKFVNGKRNAKVHQLRSHFDPIRRHLTLWVQDSQEKFSFQIDNERDVIVAWLTQYFGMPVQLSQNTVTGFPDDLNANGPTVISTATIEAIASWFPDISIEAMRLRLRCNLEISGVPAFWEDQLFADASQCVRFRIGNLTLMGINPCQRCVVPTRDARTGKSTPHFQKIFIAHRQASLPDWTTPSRFNHFYRLSVNTRVPESEAGKQLCVGDRLEILGIETLQA